MSIISVSVLGILTALVSLALRRYNSEISFSIAVVGAVLIFASVLISISSVFDTVRDIADNAGIDMSYISVMLKSVGICFLTEFASDCCADAGQNALATNVSTAGKLLVLITAMPMYSKVLDIVLDLVKV